MSSARDFWSDRRARVAAEAKAEQAFFDSEKIPNQHTAPEERTEAEILAELDLPEPETLEQGDDFTVFMEKAVPEQIRRRALRALWRTNPILANVDQLVDYGEDFTDSATVIDNLQTTYQVGKGMLAHVQEMARQAEAAARAEDDEQVDPDVEDSVVGDGGSQETLTAVVKALPCEATGQGDSADVTDEIAQIDGAVEATPFKRRMKFRFEETA